MLYNLLCSTIHSIFSGNFFSGGENLIYLLNEYYTEFICEYDLKFYPFDTQVCEMKFEMIGNRVDRVVFEEGALNFDSN